MRLINKAGLDLIKSFEGCSLKSYLDSVGILTIGYGHTGPDVKKNQKITQEQANTLLEQDILKFCRIVDDRINVKLNDNQFAALVSLTYNIGPANYYKSTLLKLINRGQLVLAGEEFLKWDKAGGKVLAGLTRRRQAEKDLWTRTPTTNIS